jgi:hypothetical protein
MESSEKHILTIKKRQVLKTLITSYRLIAKKVINKVP